MKFGRLLTLSLLAAASISSTASARVVRVVIFSRADIAGSFGSAGIYERITGRGYCAFDPRNPENRKIVDLSLAPRNANGEVEAISEFVMLRPKDSTLAANVAVIDIVNRGGITTFVFNLGGEAGATTLSRERYGDALLMDR